MFARGYIDLFTHTPIAVTLFTFILTMFSRSTVRDVMLNYKSPIMDLNIADIIFDYCPSNEFVVIAKYIETNIEFRTKCLEILETKNKKAYKLKLKKNRTIKQNLIVESLKRKEIHLEYKQNPLVYRAYQMLDKLTARLMTQIGGIDEIHFKSDDPISRERKLENLDKLEEYFIKFNKLLCRFEGIDSIDIKVSSIGAPDNVINVVFRFTENIEVCGKFAYNFDYAVRKILYRNDNHYCESYYDYGPEAIYAKYI